ncbi:ferredoxin-fold anticodon-binding domain-containing protein 1 [Aulostomus maculatus]
MFPSRSLLLVGEGNFSFSASMCRFYSSLESSSITATCLQPQEEVLRHEGASSNIQTIKDSGGTVLFEVDCTNLGENASLQGRVFDRVVFNFPHCGRKSGVKKNKQLLKNFFLSCVQVLAEDGEVHVSLCNGQGGTPADQPKRERHNSWQIVAMAAEAHLILSDVRPFESETYQSYKCTGYRSQDKGFHLENALLHVFTRSLPYSAAQTLKVEEAVEGEEVQYFIPTELTDYIFRGFLSSDSVHPVRLVHDFLHQGLTEKWTVSMATDTLPLLLTTKQLQACYHDTDSALCYWIDVQEKDLNSDTHIRTGIDQLMLSDSTASSTYVTFEKVDCLRSKGAESFRSACSLDVDPDADSDLYVLRPSLQPQMEELLSQKEDWANNAGRHMETGWKYKWVEGKKEEESCGNCNGVPSLLCGVSGLVFRNVPISLWGLPVFHELLLRGVFPSDYKPMTMLEQRLEALLAPYGVSLVTEQGGLLLTAQPMGLVGKVHASDSSSHISITASFNLDLLAVLLFSLPDWRLLWSHDPRFLKQFALRPSPGTCFHPFSLFPEPFSFDISFWTGPTWEEKKFYALVREAGHGTVEHVKMIDRFSHPDLSQTSYCYRLIYHSHTHALSHTQALQLHKHLESLLSSRLQVTIR